jgi:hypothetical protein
MARGSKRIWLRISESLRYFLVGGITMIQPVDFIPSDTVKWLSFGMGLGILLLKSIDMGVGIQPREPKVKVVE